MKASLLFAILVGFSARMEAKTISFDAPGTGALPAGWTVAMTHSGGAPKWEVLKDDSAPSKPNVLAQTSSDKTRNRFPLAILDQSTAKDGELRVSFKPLSGEIDQAAGLVWRYRDENNYYLLRANALEDNVVLYKVEGGTRTALAPKGTAPGTYSIKHEVPAKVWSTLAVQFHGNMFTVMLDGKKLFDVEDNTFTDAGRVGLWTKADSVTYFDDFEFSPR
jgi:hypothetical protein